MNASLILWPVLAQILLTVVIYLVLGSRRFGAVKSGQVSLNDALAEKVVWPDEVGKAARNLANQFESPVLFYTLSLLLFTIDGVGVAALLLAWAFVLCRAIHAYIHVGSNYIPARFRVFLVGCLMLMLMLVLAGSELLML